MSTLFLNGLMPERHGYFIRKLAGQYNLCGTRLAGLAQAHGFEIIDFEADYGMMNSPLARDLQARLQTDTRTLADNLAADIQHCPLGPAEGWQLSDREIEESIRPRVANLLIQELKFRVFLEHHPVDMVISGSDYGSHARIIARVARQLGIPTLNMEHAFFFNHIAPRYSRTRGKMPMFFTSEFVNLDNSLEQEAFEQELAKYPDQGTRFLSLGTPLDTVASHTLPREEAIARLGLDQDKIQILLAGSWNEARSVQKLVRAQIETIELYEDLFQSLAKSEFRHRMQLTIKLHPAEARPDVFPGVKAGLDNMAQRCGLPCPLILPDRLDEALSACDLVLSLSYSSILFDAFLLGKPAVVALAPFLVYSEDEDWQTQGTLPHQAGVSVAVCSGSEAWQKVDDYLRPEGREKFRQDHAKFSAKYGLQHHSVDQKCETVMAWIAEHLQNSKEKR